MDIHKPRVGFGNPALTLDLDEYFLPSKRQEVLNHQDTRYDYIVHPQTSMQNKSRWLQAQDEIAPTTRLHSVNIV